MLARALREDAAVMAVALRRAVRSVMPYAVALDNCAAPLSPDQRATVPALSAGADTALRLVVELDEVLEKLIESALLREIPTLRGAEAESLGVELMVFTEQLKQLVVGQSSAVLIDLSETLGRKIQGARDAISFSADPVSQAANSLIELIDRLLRQAFDEPTVLSWIAQNYPAQPDLHPGRFGHAAADEEGAGAVLRARGAAGVAAVGVPRTGRPRAGGGCSI